MTIFDFGLERSKEKTKELYQKHYLNAINGLLASGRTDYDNVIQDANLVATKAIEFILKTQKSNKLDWFKKLLDSKID